MGLIKSKILYISTNAIGDTYLAISGAEYANSNIFNKSNYDFITLNELNFLFLDELNTGTIFYIEKKNILSLLKYILKIRKQKYEYAINIFPGVFNSLLLVLSNAKVKIGYVNYVKNRDWFDKAQKLFVKGRRDKGKIWRPGQNYLDRINLIFASLTQNNHNVKKYVYNTVELKFRGADVIFHFVSRGDSRNLPTELSKTILRRVYEVFNLKMAIIDTDGTYSSFYKEFYILSGNNFQKVIDYISSSKIFIGVDSFPLHLADAYNKKIIGLSKRKYFSALVQNKNNLYILDYDNTDWGKYCDNIILLLEKILISKN